MPIKIRLGEKMPPEEAKKMADERHTYGVEYCAMTSVDLHGVMQRAGLEEAERT
jgi:hypothetical protein